MDVLNGRMFTGRDAVHAHLMKHEPPVDMQGSVLAVTEVDEHATQMSVQALADVLSARIDELEKRMEKLGLSGRVNLALDAGCGTGEGASRLAELFPRARVLGVDLVANVPGAVTRATAWIATSCCSARSSSRRGASTRTSRARPIPSSATSASPPSIRRMPRRASRCAMTPIVDEVTRNGSIPISFSRVNDTAALFVGSWSHWIADPTRPIATGR